MELLAGINLAWSVFYVFVSILILALHFGFGRNRDYLVFSVMCAEMSVFSASRVSFYISPDVTCTVMAGRVMMAILAPAVATLLHLALRRSGMSGRRLLAMSGCAHLVAIAFMALSLAGLALDYDTVQVKTLGLGPLFEVEGFSEYAVTPLGFALTLSCLAGATAASILLVRSFKGNRFVLGVLATTLAIVCATTLHDILLSMNLIRSIYLVEHGTFLFFIGVLASFLGEFERSQRELRTRTRALEEANENLERLHRDLSESSLRLDRARTETHRLRPMADLGRLSASLAHEIRNPLAVLSNVASSLRHHGRTRKEATEFDSLVEMMQEETDRLARLVDDLLLFSQSGRISREPVDPAALVELAVTDVREQFSSNEGLEIQSRVADDAPLVPGSTESLRRALVNLIVNAVQSSGGSGPITVIARRDEDRSAVLMLGVRDEAGGIPEEVMGEIFEPFFSTRPTGTGLGLPIVKSIVEAHDGDLLLENRPGEGTTFWMLLPLVT